MTAPWWQKLAQCLRSFTPGQKVALLALLLWLVSLTLTGFVVADEKQRSWQGVEILVMGWLGPMSGSVAWYANPLALWVFMRCFSAQAPTRSSVLACLLGLTVVFFSDLLISLQLIYAPVYGFGWGAVLWLCALTLLLVATGLRQQELAGMQVKPPVRTRHLWPLPLAAIVLAYLTWPVWLSGCIVPVVLGAWLSHVEARASVSAKPLPASPELRAQIASSKRTGRRLVEIGLLACALIVGVTTWFATTDRLWANPTELVRLRAVAFKRGPVCEALDAVVTQRVNLADGALELVADGENYRLQPLNELEKLLEWGVPVVRSGKREYRLVNTGQKPVLSSAPASTPVVARLYATGEQLLQERTLHARLVAVAPDGSESPAWVESWRLQRGDNCPDYAPRPDTGETPRRQLFEALGLPSGGIARMSQSGVTDSAHTQAGRLLGVSEANPSAIEAPPSCPPDVGWDTEDEVDPDWPGYTPFRVGERVYDLDFSRSGKVLCAGNAAYLSRVGSGYIYLMKLRLHDMQQMWWGSIEPDKPFVADDDRDWVLEEVREGEELYLRLRSTQSGRSVEVVTSPLPGPKVN